MRRRRASFEAVALRAGAVTLEELRRAYRESRRRGERLEAALLRTRSLPPETVRAVRAAQLSSGSPASTERLARS